MTKNELFIELAQPNEQGISRWVNVNEFDGKYKPLQFGNGASWCRANSTLAKKYSIEFDKNQTRGNSIDAVKLNGYAFDERFNQNIRSDIKNFYRGQNCVMLGVNGNSVNTIIEIDHKDGRKTDIENSNVSLQKTEDFQPLCKAANDIKRQICKTCKSTHKRWDAKNIKGNPYSFYEGDEDYTHSLGCKGCYQYDPVEYRKTCVKIISREAAEYIAKKLFTDDNR